MQGHAAHITSMLSNLAAPVPTAAGALAGTGSIDELTKFLAALGGGAKLPYGGDFSFTQNLNNAGGNVTVVGDLTAKKFRVMDATGKDVFTEPEVAVRNDRSTVAHHF